MILRGPIWEGDAEGETGFQRASEHMYLRVLLWYSKELEQHKKDEQVVHGTACVSRFALETALFDEGSETVRALPSRSGSKGMQQSQSHRLFSTRKPVKKSTVAAAPLSG